MIKTNHHKKINSLEEENKFLSEVIEDAKKMVESREKEIARKASIIADLRENLVWLKIDRRLLMFSVLFLVFLAVVSNLK